MGMVGCGGISHAHGKAAAAFPDFVRFVACCDVRREAAETWAATYGCASVYTDYAEMIRKEALDGVLLATWPNQHREQIEQCLAAGARNILCEKALTLNAQEAVEIWNLVRSAKAFLMEGFMFRHHPAIRRLEELIARGEIGAVDNIRAEFGWYNGPLHPEPVPPPEQRNWRLRRDCGGGVPYDATCYAVNACGHFARALPTRVFASGTISRTLDVIMRLFGVIDYANGVNGIVLSSHAQQFSQELQIEGSAGHLHLPVAWTVNGESVIQRRHSVGWADVHADTHAVRKADSYRLQLENFIAVVKDQAQPLLPLVQSVVNTCVIEALVTSLLERRPVDIALPADIAAEYERMLKEMA